MSRKRRGKGNGSAAVAARELVFKREHDETQDRSVRRLQRVRSERQGMSFLW
jgi:hypothetical protein